MVPFRISKQNTPRSHCFQNLFRLPLPMLLLFFSFASTLRFLPWLLPFHFPFHAPLAFHPQPSGLSSTLFPTFLPTFPISHSLALFTSTTLPMRPHFNLLWMEPSGDFSLMSDILRNYHSKSQHTRKMILEIEAINFQPFVTKIFSTGEFMFYEEVYQFITQNLLFKQTGWKQVILFKLLLFVHKKNSLANN